MWDFTFIGLLILFSIIFGIDGIRKWKEIGKKSYLVAGIISIIAGLFFLIDLSSGFSILVLAAIIRVFGSFGSKKTENEEEE